LFFSDESEPTFDQIDPRRACRGEVQMEARTLKKPTLNDSRFVSSVIVQDKMNIKLIGYSMLDLVEEFAELSRAMATMKLTNYCAGFGVTGLQKARWCRRCHPLYLIRKDETILSIEL